LSNHDNRPRFRTCTRNTDGQCVRRPSAPPVEAG